MLNGRRVHNLLSTALVGTLAFAAGSGGIAQAVAAQDEAGAAPAVGVEEIVVTAQKRAENLQTVPIAISAFGSETLNERQITGVRDLAEHVPNLQFSTGAGGGGNSSNLFIRGIGQMDFITTTDPGVGTYVDGVYFARVSGAALDLGDVERLEVLRGPQGTLFGRNTIGGALNVTTARPSDKFEGRAEVTLGNLERRDGRLMLNLPVDGDRLAFRFNFLTRNTDGYGTNTRPDGRTDRLGSDKDLAGRGQLLFKPTEDLEFLLSAYFTRRRGTAMPHGLVAFAETPTTIGFNSIRSRLRRSGRNIS